MNKKAVLMSIRPEWVRHIFIDKDKKFEVRKRAPLISAPYKVYVYCTKREPIIYRETVLWKGNINGFVCGEFTCIANWEREPPWKNQSWGTCLTDRQLAEYACMEKLIFMEIENPILYDIPKKLSDFGVDYAVQSWQYVEELGNV